MSQQTSFLSQEEISKIGFKACGFDLKISRYARFYSPNMISLGNNVRIDDFCILSGDITIGSNVHISAYVALYGAMGIVIGDYSGISPKSVVYSAMDDFSGDYLIGPIHPVNKTKVTGGVVKIGNYCQIGSNSVVFPNLEIEEGTVVGACSLVTSSLKSWGVYFGIPARRRKERHDSLKQLLINE